MAGQGRQPGANTFCTTLADATHGCQSTVVSGDLECFQRVHVQNLVHLVSETRPHARDRLEQSLGGRLAPEPVEL